ncbi:MAG: prepilin peptidase [Armatimonadetes bacterium]|nr:prepilin peptidase [Armatimonadota bacterium]
MDEPVRLVLTLFAVLAGACVGSFVNVLIFRLPRERSVVWPRSHCFCCGTELASRDLVPVFSYLLGGRCCRYCGVALSSQYAWVEAATALVFGAIVYRWGASLASAAYCVAGAALLAGFMTDVRHKIIPLPLTVTVAAAGVAAAVLGWLWPSLAGTGPPRFPPTPAAALGGAALGWVVFESIVRVGRLVYGQEAMGGGDVQLAGALGFLLGPGRRFWTFFMVAVIVGAMVALALLLVRRMGRREAIAFGPFLVVGALAMMLWPELADLLAHQYGFR